MKKIKEENYKKNLAVHLLINRYPNDYIYLPAYPLIKRVFLYNRSQPVTVVIGVNMNSFNFYL